MKGREGLELGLRFDGEGGCKKDKKKKVNNFYFS